MSKFLNNKLFRYVSVFLFLNSAILPVKSSSALAAWALKKNGVLELRTKSNTNLKAYFQKANKLYGDCLLYTSPSPRDGLLSRMPSSA